MVKNIQKSRVIPLVFLAGIAYACMASILYNHNPPTAYTGAPNESNCTSCHSGSLNPVPSNLANMTFSGGFSGGGYVPDSTYSITLSYSQSGINKYGFEMTALTTSNNAPAGTFSAGTGSSVASQTVNGGSRSYVRQTSSGTSGSGGRSWTFTWHAPATNVDTVTFYATVNAANGDGNDGGDQIYTKKFKIPLSSLLPVAKIQTSKNIVCAGDTMTLYGSGTNNPTSYFWKFHQGSPSTASSQNVVRYYSAIGTFSDTLWVTNSKGTSQPVRHLTTVVVKPNSSITSISPSTEACEGDSITLTALTGNGYSYSWDTGNPKDNGQSLTVFKSGSYAVTVSNTNGCSRTSNPVTLNFKPRPNSGLTVSTSKDTLCLGDTAWVIADTGFVNYDFYNGATLLQSSTSNKVPLTQVGSYAVKVEANNGTCSELSNATIHKIILDRLPSPAVSCGNTTTDELNFHWNPIPGAVSYRHWVSGSNPVTTTDTFVKIGGLTFNTKRTLWVQAIGIAACPDGLIASHLCTTLPCSQFSYNLLVSDTLVCEGDSVSLDLAAVSLTDFTVSFNGGAADTLTHFDFIADPSDQKYTLDIVDLNSPSCPAFTIDDSIFVDVQVMLPFSVSASEICQGDSVTIANQSFYNDYNLFVNSVFKENNANGSFVVNGLQDTDILLITAKGLACIHESAPLNMVVNTPIKPGFTILGSNRSWDFADTTSGIQSRSWDFGDSSAIQTNATISHTYATNGSFDVRLITMDDKGCIDSTSQVVQSDNVGLKDAIKAQVKVYPNPARDIVVIESALELAGAELWTLQGQRIALQSSKAMQYQFDLSGMAPGTYFIKLTFQDQETIIRFIKE